MTHGFPRLAALIALLAVVGCDSGTTDADDSLQTVPEAAPDDPAYEALVQGVGGIDALSHFMATSTDAEAAALVAAYGMSFEVVDVSEQVAGRRDVTTCSQFYPTADRTKWFRLTGAGGAENHYIDSRGRPATAFKSLGPVVTAARQTSCQTTVGNWGSPASSYDGGHMIGSQLGGWGGRANMVPQHYNFNRGNWAKIENALARCARLGGGAVEYHVDVDYPSSSALVPSQFHADVKIAGQWKSADFTNTTYGGSYGTSRANSMVSWLQSKGCY